MIRLYLDEDVHEPLARALRARGLDALHTLEIGRRGVEDRSQLLFAAQEGRVLVSFNVGDYARLHEEFVAKGMRHSGIVVSIQLPLGEVLRRLEGLVRTLSAEEMANRLEFLSQWR